MRHGLAGQAKWDRGQVRPGVSTGSVAAESLLLRCTALLKRNRSAQLWVAGRGRRVARVGGLSRGRARAVSDRCAQVRWDVKQLGDGLQENK